MNLKLLTFLTLGLVSNVALAAKDADLKPVLTKPGKSVSVGDLTSGALKSPWNVAKGEWQVQDGVIVGKEKESDKHAAVLFLALPKQDSVLRFSFKLDSSKQFAMSMNTAQGHLFRVGVASDGLTVLKDPDKKDPKSKSEALGKADAKFSPSEWHTMLVEIKGEKVTVQTDNGAKVEVSGPALNVEKTGYRFVMRGDSFSLADVKVWDVAP